MLSSPALPRGWEESLHVSLRRASRTWSWWPGRETSWKTWPMSCGAPSQFWPKYSNLILRLLPRAHASFSNYTKRPSSRPAREQCWLRRPWRLPDLNLAASDGDAELEQRSRRRTHVFTLTFADQTSSSRNH